MLPSKCQFESYCTVDFKVLQIICVADTACKGHQKPSGRKVPFWLVPERSRRAADGVVHTAQDAVHTAQDAVHTAQDAVAKSPTMFDSKAKAQAQWKPPPPQ